MSHPRRKVLIGIDPGVKTGIAIWLTELMQFTYIKTVKIHDAMEIVKGVFGDYQRHHVFVFVEDARQRNWFGTTGSERWKGAGSICRDCSIWEDYLTDNCIDFFLRAPGTITTKMKADAFKKLTGWESPTSEHSRDAAMQVFGMADLPAYYDLSTTKIHKNATTAKGT